MAEYRLRTPVSEEEVRRLRTGDIIYVSGIVVTARDAGHRKALEILRSEGKLPLDLRGLVLYHMGPVVRRRDGEWEIVSGGPTTSARLEVYEHEFIERTGVRIIVGKGGMGERTAEACRRFGAVYAIFPGGCGALAARSIRRVREVHWLEELGVPEAMWVLEVEDFGPLMVVIDSRGNNFYEEVRREIKERLEKELLPRVGEVAREARG